MSTAPFQSTPASSDDNAKYYVDQDGDQWCVALGDATIGRFNDVQEASRFACDIARMQAQTGKVTWVFVLGDMEELHRYEAHETLEA